MMRQLRSVACLLGFVATSFADPPQAGKKLALVVGVNQYHHAKLEKLRYAENDAIDMASALKSAGFDVTLLITGEAPTKSAAPTKEEIDNRVTALLADRRRDDMILITFAGHGLQFDGEEEAYFCPTDAVPINDATGKKTLVPLNQLYKKLDDSGAGVKLLLVDACRDDPTAGRGASRGVDGSLAPRLPKGTAVLFSCSAGERAFEHDNYRHGVFFHHVLEGLRGKAKNEDGEVTWDRLVDYVKRRVSREVPKLIKGGAQQSPVHFTGGIAGEPPILVPMGVEQNARASLDVFHDNLDKASATKAKLPQKLQPIVTYVVPGGGGDRMGLRADDIVLSINGRDNLTSEGLTQAATEMVLGERVQLSVQRDGKTLTLTGNLESKYTEADAFLKMKQSAQAGDIGAMDALAFSYLNGAGVAENETEAFRWFRRAGEQGVFCAQRWVGRLYADGRGVARDPAEAVKWYRRAADLGDAESQNFLGVAYSDGTGVAADVNEAVKWFQRSADQGHSWGLLNLARCLRDGIGIAKDTDKALALAKQSADQGLEDAMIALGDAYREGTGVPQSDAESFRHYKRAADRNNAEAQNRIGIFYDTGKHVTKDAKEAVKWFHKSAAQNFDWGQYNLATKYEAGDGIEENQTLAFRWFKKAAEQGLADAQNKIGILYFRGQGVDKNLEQSAMWFRRSAEQGDAEGQNHLGNVYYSGNGLPKDLKEAAQWYLKSAEQGNADGQYNIGTCYRDGEGVKKDLAEARKWLKKAADQRHEEAQTALKNLPEK